MQLDTALTKINPILIKRNIFAGVDLLSSFIWSVPISFQVKPIEFLPRHYRRHDDFDRLAKEHGRLIWAYNSLQMPLFESYEALLKALSFKTSKHTFCRTVIKKSE